MDEATPEKPVYRAIKTAGRVGDQWMVTVDEGWRSSVLCSGMYGWAANWLVDQLQGRPVAPDTRP